MDWNIFFLTLQLTSGFAYIVENMSPQEKQKPENQLDCDYRARDV